MLSFVKTRTGNREQGTVLAVLFASAVIVFAPKMALAVACSPDLAPYGVDAICEPTCSSGRALARNFAEQVHSSAKAAFFSASCTNGQCCVKLGPPLCGLEAKLQGYTAGDCKSSCGSDVASKYSYKACPGSQKCCYSSGPAQAPAGPGCSTLAGVSSSCKDAATADELNLNSTPALATYIASGQCPGKVCAAKKGSELCAAFAKAGKQNGTFVCTTTSNCATPLSATYAQQGAGACPSGQDCCIAKAAAAPGVAGKPVTLPDPLSGLNFPRLIGNVIRTFSGIAGSLALLMFVYGGIMWILSGGESAKIQKAQKILINASIGLVLIFSAYTFVSSIVDTILQPPTTSTEQTP